MRCEDHFTFSFHISLIVRYLPRCLEKGDAVEARGTRAIASTLAGMAFQNALVGGVRGMARALGGMCGLHRGLAKTAVADPGMRSNIRKVIDPQEIIPVLLTAR